MAKMNPQRLAFKEAYCNPESDTFGNAYQSALKAGFSEEYAKNITGQGVEWVSEIIRDQELLGQAEKNLKELLTQVDDIKVRADITKFVASTLGKKKYSSRQEVTGADGKELPTPILAYVHSNNSNQEDTEPSGESTEERDTNTSDTGGDIGREDNQQPHLLDTLSTN